jgi:hypothetical protein
LGLVLFLGACVVARQGLSWHWALVPGIMVSLALEGVEIWEAWGPQKLGASSPKDLLAIAVRHSRDVLIMNLAPALVLLAAILIDRFSGR